MNEKNKIIIGNATTIINTISLMMAGIIFGILGAFGLHLPIDEYGLAGIIGLIIATIFSYVNAKYHNSFFNTEENTITIDIDNLTEEQIIAIQTFIDNITKTNLQNELTEDYVGDVDPASEYEDM